MSKKIISVLLALTLALGCCSALAENTKHERVYVVTKPDGTVKSITDNIRLENTDGLEELIDRTMLTSIENLGGKESFVLDGETLTWQAKGNDISYQGTSEKTPVILPIVHLTLDGQEISAEELKDKTGEAVLTISYQMTESLPVLAVTVLPLPETGVSDLKLENATVLSEMGRQVLVGWAVPGMDEKLELPASFTATFHADHAELNWMMTLTTADPIDLACRELDERIDMFKHLLHLGHNVCSGRHKSIGRRTNNGVSRHVAVGRVGSHSHVQGATSQHGFVQCGNSAMRNLHVLVHAYSNYHVTGMIIVITYVRDNANVESVGIYRARFRKRFSILK